MCLISIVVPVFNAERFLKDTITSIVNQTYTNIEVILVNDGSTDDSQRIIEEFASNDNRVKSIVTANHGAPHARNIGLEAAKGEYVIFFDSDDIMLPDEVRFLSDGTADDIDLVIGGHITMTENGSHYKRNTYAEGLYDPTTTDIEYLMSMLPFPDNKLYSADVLRKNSLCFHDVKIAQDVNLYYKYLAVCRKVHVLSEPVCLYRVVSNSISHTYTSRILDIQNCLEDIRMFAEKSNNTEEYNIALHSVAFNHIYKQMRKIQYMADKSLKCHIIDVLGEYANKIRLCTDRLNQTGSEYYKLIQRMVKYRWYFTSKAYYISRMLYRILYRKVYRRIAHYNTMKR